jgi:hypothetical protein
MKYIAAKAVSMISEESTVGFFSYALKYPWNAMLENARIWRNIVPPIHPNPRP